jgi:hypothetical protein
MMSSMADNDRNAPQSDQPYGTVPRRAAFPLLVWIALFICWFAFLIVLALREAALR